MGTSHRGHGRATGLRAGLTMLLTLIVVGMYSLAGATEASATPSAQLLQKTSASTPESGLRIGLLAALGDSYSAGNGTPDATGVCQRSPQAWPNLVPYQVDTAPGTPLFLITPITLLACSGADSNGPGTPSEGNGGEDLPYQIGVLQSLTTPRPAVVTVTIGGDDGGSANAGFTNVLTFCAISSLLCDYAVYQEVSWLGTQEPALLHQDYAAISAADPKATILAVGYPEIFTPNISCSFYNGTETLWFDELTLQLDREIAQAASSVPGVKYVDTTSAFQGHNACSSDPYVVVPGLSNPLGWFHPNPAGQHAIASDVAAFVVKNAAYPALPR